MGIIFGGLRILLSIGESMEESCSSSPVNDYGFKRKNDKHFDWTIYDSVFQITKLLIQSKGHGTTSNVCEYKDSVDIEINRIARQNIRKMENMDSAAKTFVGDWGINNGTQLRDLEDDLDRTFAYVLNDYNIKRMVASESYDSIHCKFSGPGIWEDLPEQYISLL